MQEYAAAAAAKIVLLGEHAVVYGSHALAAPIADGVRARVEDCETPGVRLVIPAWEVDALLDTQNPPNGLHACLGLIIERLQVANRSMTLYIAPRIPRAAGLGASAAVAVAVIRALDLHFELRLDDAAVNALAFASEQLAHGTASGVDNTMATYGRFLLFRRGDPPTLSPVTVREPIPVVIGLTGKEGLTHAMVGKVRAAWQSRPRLYEHIFSEIDALVLRGREAVECHDLDLLGALMNVNQGWLNALQVSSLQLEELVQLTREHGALGAKLTGGGGGGAMIALCPDNSEAVAEAVRRAGYQALTVSIG